MEQDTSLQDQDQGKQKKKKLFDVFPFLKYLKSRLVSYVDYETGKRYIGHVAMFYIDTNQIRIDWDNGAQTYHLFNENSMWLFKLKQNEKHSSNMVKGNI